MRLRIGIPYPESASRQTLLLRAAETLEKMGLLVASPQPFETFYVTFLKTAALESKFLQTELIAGQLAIEGIPYHFNPLLVASPVHSGRGFSTFTKPRYPQKQNHREPV